MNKSIPIKTESQCVVRVNQYYWEHYNRKLTEEEISLVLLTYRILKGDDRLLKKEKL